MTTAPTALEVFMDFVVRYPDGTLDVSKIFSQECFQKWVGTRKGYLKHPEQSFHRTLVCHVRGLERRAFPANVEAELLKLLRRKDINIWDNCFEDSANVLHIGKFGFRHVGFHERPQESEDVIQHSDCIVQGDNSDLRCEQQRGNSVQKTRRSRLRQQPRVRKPCSKSRKKLTPQNSLSSATHLDADQDTNDELENHNHTEDLEHDNDIEAEKYDSDVELAFNLGDAFGENRLVANAFRQNCFAEDLYLDNYFHAAGELPRFRSYQNSKASASPLLSVVQGLTGSIRTVDSTASGGDIQRYSDSTRSSLEQNTCCPWEALGKMLIQYKPESFVNDVEKMSAKIGINAFPPALVYLMKQPKPEHDPRFDYDFVFPGEPERVFRDDPNFPIGSVIVDSYNMVLKDADPIAKQLLRRELVGDPLFIWLASLLEFWYGFIEYIPRLVSHPETWKRRCLRRGDGTVGLYLTKATPLKLQKNKAVGLVRVEMQDISDTYPEILRRSFFI